MFGHCLPTGKKINIVPRQIRNAARLKSLELFVLFRSLTKKNKPKQCRRPEIRLGRANERVVPGLFSAILIGRTQIERWIRTTNGPSIKIWRT